MSTTRRVKKTRSSI